MGSVRSRTLYLLCLHQLPDFSERRSFARLRRSDRKRCCAGCCEIQAISRNFHHALFQPSSSSCGAASLQAASCLHCPGSRSLRSPGLASLLLLGRQRRPQRAERSCRGERLGVPFTPSFRWYQSERPKALCNCLEPDGCDVTEARGRESVMLCTSSWTWFLGDRFL